MDFDQNKEDFMEIVYDKESKLSLVTAAILGSLFPEDKVKFIEPNGFFTSVAGNRAFCFLDRGEEDRALNLILEDGNGSFTTETNVEELYRFITKKDVPYHVSFLSYYLESLEGREFKFPEYDERAIEAWGIYFFSLPVSVMANIMRTPEWNKGLCDLIDDLSKAHPLLKRIYDGYGCER